jgi:cation diffusion facilitator family transporter
MSRAKERDEGSLLVLYSGLASNVLVAATKFVAAALTGSAAMLSEGMHSLVDTSNEVLLLYGRHRSGRVPDRKHPFGYGREAYFWSFMVSLVMLGLGAGVSLVVGVRHFLDPQPLDRPIVKYVVLAVAAVFELIAWWFSLREFNVRRGRRGFVEAAQATKDPGVVIVLIENSSDVIGIVLAAAGTAATQAFGDSRYDALASIAIGVLLAAGAVFLAVETKQLLIGEAARPSLRKSIARIARSERGVYGFNGMLTVQLAPDEVVVALSVHFNPGLRTTEVQEVIRRIETKVRRRHEDVVLLFVKPQSPEVYRRARSAWIQH